MKRSWIKRVNHKRRARLRAKQFGDHADYIQCLPCLVCQGQRVHAHHVHSRGAGGDESDLVPLCASHHSEGHQHGWKTFGKKYAIDLPAEAALLWSINEDNA